VVAGIFVVATTTVSVGMLWLYEWPPFLAPVGRFIVLGVMLVLCFDA
jgi:hypothetical protein